MAGASPKYSLGLAVFIEARFAEAGVRADVVLFEVKTVLDQRRASKSVIAHAVATNPGIQESQREEKQENEPALRIESLRSARAERLTFHEQKSVLEECRERKLLRSHFQNKQAAGNMPEATAGGPWFRYCTLNKKKKKRKRKELQNTKKVRHT